jgi:hypothetical protein
MVANAEIFRISVFLVKRLVGFPVSGHAVGGGFRNGISFFEHHLRFVFSETGLGAPCKGIRVSGDCGEEEGEEGFIHGKSLSRFEVFSAALAMHLKKFHCQLATR